MSSLNKQVRTVAMARPMIVVLGALGMFWAAGNLVMAITAVLRIIKGSGARDNLEPGEAILLVLGISFTLLTPLILVIRWLSKTVWANSVKSLELSDTLRRPVLVGLSAYGFASLLVRLIEAVLLRHAVGRRLALVGRPPLRGGRGGRDRGLPRGRGREAAHGLTPVSRGGARCAVPASIG